LAQAQQGSWLVASPKEPDNSTQRRSSPQLGQAEARLLVADSRTFI